MMLSVARAFGVRRSWFARQRYELLWSEQAFQIIKPNCTRDKLAIRNNDRGRDPYA